MTPPPSRTIVHLRALNKSSARPFQPRLPAPLLCLLPIAALIPLTPLTNPAHAQPHAPSPASPAKSPPATQPAPNNPSARQPWQLTVSVPRPPDRRGRPQQPSIAHLWLPDTQQPLRALFIAQQVGLERKLLTHPAIRAFAQRQAIGIVYYEPPFNALFDVKQDAHELFLQSLYDLALAADQPNLPCLPWITIGHSTTGIFARNVAYWQPERVLAVIHLKSGNLHQHLPAPNASLAGVPFLAINGEFEEFGPESGLVKPWARQTQWIMIRKQLLERRAADPANLMALVLHPGGNHTNWSDQLTSFLVAYLEAVCTLRLPDPIHATGPANPADAPLKAPLLCKPIPPHIGWLVHADIKAPQPLHPSAPVPDFKAPHHNAFWLPDQTTAALWAEIHKPGTFCEPDPSTGDQRTFQQVLEEARAPTTTAPQNPQP